MKRQSKSVDNLLAGAKFPHTSDTDSTTLLHRQLIHADMEVATEVAKEHAIAKADSEYGEAIKDGEVEQRYLSKAVKHSNEQLADLRQMQKAIPQKLKNNQLSEGQKTKVPFLLWRKSDLLAVVCMLIALICLLVTSAANVYVSLIASGEAAFIDSPWIALFISLLLPSGSLAIKFFINSLYDPRSKKLYCLGLYALTGLALLCWIIVFAGQFGGVSEGINWDDLGDTDTSGKSNVLNFLQLVAEVLCAACLAHAIEEINSKYDPDVWLDNPEYYRLSRAVMEQEKIDRQLHDELKRCESKLVKLQSEHKGSVLRDTAAYASLRSGFGVIRSTTSFIELVKFGTIVMLAILLGVSVSSNASAKTLVVGISPFVEEATYDKQSKQLLQALTEHLQLGDEAVLIDAYQLQVIGRFSIPDQPAYRSAKARLKVNAQTVGTLLNWQKNLPEDLERPDTEGVIKLPQFLRYVALNHSYALKGEGADILIFGSPFYGISDSDPFRMTAEGIIPSDGHLHASRSLSVYGTADSKGMLQGWRIHQGYGENIRFGSDRIAFAVERWWTLFVESMGGKLSTFTPDLDAVIRRALEGTEPFHHHYVPEDTNRLQMLHLYINDQRNRLPIQERPLTVTPLSQSSIHQAENVTIGLSWNCACDLDLYARPHRNSDILSFNNRETNEGEYFQDVRGSSSGGHRPNNSSMETIVFSVPIDLSKLQISVSHYSGTVDQPIEIDIRISIDDKTYAKSFLLASTVGKGNRLVAESFASGTAAANHIVIINPLDVIQTVSQ